MLRWKLVLRVRQIEWLVKQNLQEGSTIKILIYIFPAIVQQNLTSQLGVY